MTTSRTGQPARTSRKRAGTSLIELILVMALLAAMAAIVAPRLSGFSEGRQYVGEWNRLLATIRYGRSQAIARGMPVEIRFDDKRKSYRLIEDAYSTNKGPTDTLNEKGVENDRSDNVKKSDQNPRSTTEPAVIPTEHIVALGATVEHVLPKKLAFEFPDEAERSEGGIAIHFEPDGTLDEESPKTFRLVEQGGPFARSLEESAVFGYVAVKETDDDRFDSPAEKE